MTLASSRINQLAVFVNAACYLEIGVREGHTFAEVRVSEKHGVDPCFESSDEDKTLNQYKHSMSSDQFFASRLGRELIVDVAYVDGLHRADQALRDVLSCFDCGADVVLLDDVWPCDRFSAMPSYELALAVRAEHGNPYHVHPQAWHGDVYKAAMTLAMRPEFCVNTIIGYGNPQSVITRSFAPKTSSQPVVSFDSLDYEQFLEQGVKLLNCAGEPTVMRLVRDRLDTQGVAE